MPRSAGELSRMRVQADEAESRYLQDPGPTLRPRNAGEPSRKCEQAEEAESRMEPSSPSGSHCADRSSDTPLIQLPLHESELEDSQVREQHEGQDQPICKKQALRMEPSSPSGSHCADRSSDTPLIQEPLHESELEDSQVREQHEGQDQPICRKQALRPFVFPCFIAVSIISFLLVMVVIILAALLQQKKCSSDGVAMRLEPCPPDWLYNGRTCYYFSKEREDWNQSQLFCSFHNSSLALINSQRELNFLVELTCEHHHWIGLRRRGDTFEWANGTACNNTLCTIKDFGECAYIEDAAVRVSGCSLTRPYICTREPFVGT